MRCGRRTTDDGRRFAGFTLLEVMIALMILAMGLAAVTFANSVAISQVARVTRITTASFLMEGVVNDIHAHYVRKGFPSNSLEDKQCELPRDFADTFTCRYDLKAMNLTPDVIQGMVQAGIESFMGGGSAGGTAPGAGASGTGATGAAKSALDGLAGAAGGGAGGTGAGGTGTGTTGISPTPKPAAGQLDLQAIAMLAPLFGPQGQDIIRMCNINLSAILMGVTTLTSYMPQIVDQVAKRTRQLTVRLTWKDGPRKQRELKVQTYVVSLPEDEVQQLKDRERAREAADAINDLVQSSAPQDKGKDDKGKRTK